MEENIMFRERTRNRSVVNFFSEFAFRTIYTDYKKLEEAAKEKYISI